MVEDISAQGRISVEVASLGSLLMVIITLMVSGSALLSHYENKLIHAYQDVSNVTLNELSVEQYITSANAYKAVVSLSTAVDTVNVKRKDGSTKTLTINGANLDTSFEYLLHEPSVHYSMSMSKMNGSYSFKLQEVD